MPQTNKRYPICLKVYLQETTHERLKALAGERETSVSALMRQAVAQLLAEQTPAS